MEQFVPEELLAVIVKGLAETAGFEETLMDDTQQDAIDFEAVPDEFNFEEIRKTFDVQPISSRSMDDVREGVWNS